MSCNCVSEIDKQLEEHKLKLKSGFLFGKNDALHVPEIAIVTLDGKKPKSGQPKYLIPSFCPFCGVEIDVEVKPS